MRRRSVLGVALTFALFYPAYSLAAVETGRGIRRKSNAKLRPRYLSWRSHAVSAANRQVPQARHPRAWGADSPPRLAVNEHPAGCLFNRQNLALRENNSPSSCVSPAAVAVANCLIRFVCAERGIGYKVDISKTKSGYKVDTIVSSL